MSFTYRTEQWLPYPLPAVFAFLANPGNLPRLMPAWQQARIDKALIVPPVHPAALSPRATIAAGTGTQLTLSFRPFPHAPFRVTWEAEISEFVWNDHFCDRQGHGPFAVWSHRHSVRPSSADGASGTYVADHVEYELPFGPLGRLAHSLWLREQIERSFAYRQIQLDRQLARITLEAETSAKTAPAAKSHSRP
jgi:ligand-binding SRPBCC domain-containing protein